MATLTRKFLSTLGIEEDKADAIMEKHQEVLTEIKAERDKYKDEAEQLPEVQKQLDKLKEAEKKAAESGDKDPYKVKYEALKEEFDKYKTDIETKEIKAKKEGAYKDLLKNAGISEKRIDAILKVSDIDSIEFDEEGKVKKADELTENIKTEWADFIQTKGMEGAKTATPPGSSGSTNDLGKMSMAEYIKARKEM